MIDVSIIIVSFNARADLERCLASLHETPAASRTEVIVVDNESTDGSADAARHWPDIKVIDTDSNLGFAKAANIGIRASSGAHVLLLNSDTLVPAGAVDGLLAALKRHPVAAVVGPRLVDEEGRVELSFGMMISPVTEYRQRRLMNAMRRGNSRVLARINEMTRREQWPDWVSGACLLVERAAADAVGLLDERFFMYTEDVDFCAAIRSRGRRVLFTPDVQVVHRRGQSVLAAPTSTYRAYRRSQLAFYRKHHPLYAPFLRLYQRLRD